MIGLLVTLGRQGVNVGYARMLLLGGLLSAPTAAWLVRIVPPKLPDSSAGGFIALINARTLEPEVDISRRHGVVGSDAAGGMGERADGSANLTSESVLVD